MSQSLSCCSRNRRRRVRRGLIALVLAAILGHAGCARLPRHEFSAYRDTFKGVELVAREILADYDAAKRNTTQSSSDHTDRFPIALDVQSALSARTCDAEIAARFAALDAIGEYNRLLTSLSDGTNSDEIRQHADRLWVVLETLDGFALPSPLNTELLADAIVMCKRARDRMHFVELAERGAPLIDSLLNMFIQDAENFYGVRVAAIGIQLNERRRQIASARATLDDLAAQYGSPPAGTELSRRRSRVESEANRISTVIAPGLESALPVGNASYDEGAQARLDAQLTVLQGLAAQEQVLVDSLNTYHSALLEYVDLLDKTRAYLAAFRQACTEGSAANAQTEIITLGRDLAKESEELLAVLRSTRAAVTY